MDNLKKNLLDLQHDLYSVKGASFLGFGIIGAFSFYSIAKEFINEKTIALLLSIIWLGIFGALAVKQFSNCNNIQLEIKDKINSN
ncbi:hypothetical protein HYW74_04130 [Candidatus Pacearchaeota archaeon]|nr:hypothetical protein [Candidatus Pacearchaeota archaeon]